MKQIKVKGSNNRHRKGCFIELYENKIAIINFRKPIIIIKNKNYVSIFNGIQNNSWKLDLNLYSSIVIDLYDKYFLNIGEIAALFKSKYNTMNRFILSLPTKTTACEGRRNSNYNIPTSKEKSEKMSKSLMGRESYWKTHPIRKEARIKISETLKRKNASGEIVQDGIKQSQAWKDGKYMDVVFNNGYCGEFTSITYNTTFGFRSLLELGYLLYWEKKNFNSLIIEPFAIDIMLNGKESCYIPDALIDDKYLIEIKPAHLLIQPRCKKDGERQIVEELYATQYAKENNLIFKICTDEDIGFKWGDFKKYLNENPQIIKRYNIEFANKNPIEKGA